MDDEFCRQAKAGGEDGFARLDGRNPVAGRLHLGRAGGLENGSADAASHGQVGIGGVDDGVNPHLCDVLPDDGQGHAFTFLPAIGALSREAACGRLLRRKRPGLARGKAPDAGQGRKRISIVSHSAGVSSASRETMRRRRRDVRKDAEGIARPARGSADVRGVRQRGCARRKTPASDRNRGLVHPDAGEKRAREAGNGPLCARSKAAQAAGLSGRPAVRRPFPLRRPGAEAAGGPACFAQARRFGNGCRRYACAGAWTTG